MSFQVGSSLLDACVLGLLSKGDSYGYDLTQDLKEVLTISDSTLYPVLRRLKKEGYLHTYDQPFQGRNRRYYTLNDDGTAKLKHYIEEWDIHKEKVDILLAGGTSNDTK